MAKTKAPNYASYLKVSSLLELQEPLSEPVAHDEMLFIVIHQTYELWFKQVIHEVDWLLQCLLSDDTFSCLDTLNRISEIFRVLISQVDILETMTPVDFNRFRDSINPGSGFQSAQFRELEVLLGMSIEAELKFFDHEPEWKAKISKRLANVNVKKAFIQLLSVRGLLPSRELESLNPTLLKIYNERNPRDLYSLCESLIRLDEQFQIWRFRHVQMAERMIGMKRGTGGSLGVPYLQATLSKRFFPELWDIRTEMKLEY